MPAKRAQPRTGKRLSLPAAASQQNTFTNLFQTHRIWTALSAQNRRMPYQHLHLPSIVRPQKLPVILSRQEGTPPDIYPQRALRQLHNK
jgi:hypothetical protein